MKLIVQVDRCCGHARCADTAPDIFVLNDTGYLDLPEIEVPPGKEQLALRGKRSCPEGCISVAVEES